MGFNGKRYIDFNKDYDKILEEVIQCKEDKVIAIAKNYKDKDFMRKHYYFDYWVPYNGNFIVNDYNNYIKLPTVLQSGYKKFHVYNNNYKKMQHIYNHRIVAQTWIPKITGKPEVDHINRDRSNNCVDNLRWADRVEQIENRSI